MRAVYCLEQVLQVLPIGIMSPLSRVVAIEIC